MTSVPLKLVILTLLVIGSLFVIRASNQISNLAIPESQFGLVTKKFETGSILFVPDIMLGRAVEDLIEDRGADSVFFHVKDLINQHDLAIANFEASVPVEHQKTPIFTTRFSVKEGALFDLFNAGFDVLSLANNHAHDFGEDGYNSTVASCEKVGLLCLGDPYQVSSSSVYSGEVGDTRVSVLMLHTVTNNVSTTTLVTMLKNMSETSDIQYAFIHWGNEYQSIHNDTEEALAHFLIDSGIDGIFGHHPHVVQDIEVYQGKPIFYSLGNFIFDQYFSREVQEGYMVSVVIDKLTITYTLIPYDTFEPRSTPRLKKGVSRLTMLENLLPESHFSETERSSGVLEFVR